MLEMFGAFVNANIGPIAVTGGLINVAVAVWETHRLWKKRKEKTKD